jgi:UDP-glucose 4-epimerase
MISIDNVIDALVHLTTDKNSECRVLIPADSNDLTMRELAVTIGKIVGREARLVPVPRGLARAMLRPLGRHVAANIFGDLRVDRSHWSSPPWTAPESVEVGLARALSFQVNN